jgi:REP element-mobilizing transposase RayT
LDAEEFDPNPSRRRILFRGLDPFAKIKRSKPQMPHWSQPGATYFVTYRLGDSIPWSLQQQWKEERDIWLKWHPPPWTTAETDEYDKRFTERMEHWLDAGMGECYLRRPCVRQLAENALVRFDGERHDLDSYVLMPNHCHALITPRDDYELFDLLRGVKSNSARECNKLLGREGTFWMADAYNRIVRTAAALRAYRRYIAENPTKAKLQPHEYTLVMNDVLYIEES